MSDPLKVLMDLFRGEEERILRILQGVPGGSKENCVLMISKSAVSAWVNTLREALKLPKTTDLIMVLPRALVSKTIEIMSNTIGDVSDFQKGAPGIFVAAIIPEEAQPDESYVKLFCLVGEQELH